MKRQMPVLSHRRRAITRCVNTINGKIRTVYIFMILSHCMRNAASRVQCERIVKIYIVIFPVIALMYRVIARRLCERTLQKINMHSSCGLQVLIRATYEVTYSVRGILKHCMTARRYSSAVGSCHRLQL